MMFRVWGVSFGDFKAGWAGAGALIVCGGARIIRSAERQAVRLRRNLTTPKPPHNGNRQAMLKDLKLVGVGPAPEMEIGFSPRLNVITGDNGLGKSFILDIAWWVLTRTWVDMPARPNLALEKAPYIAYAFDRGLSHHHEYDRRINNWPRLSLQSDFEELILYAKIDNGFAVFDPLRNRPKPPESTEPDRPGSYIFSFTEAWDGLKKNSKALCNGLIDDWSSWQKENGASFQALCRVLETLSPSDDEKLVPGKLTRISLDDVRDIPSLKMPYGQEVPIVMASAAIKRIISFAYLLVWTWQEHRKAAEFLGLPEPKDTRIVFLIDEAECHLHPHWQRRIFRALLEVMRALSESSGVQVQIIATTHSPLILASLEPFFDEQQDALFGLELARGAEGQAPQVEIHKLLWRKHGEADNWLISEAFGNLLKSARSAEAEALLEQANAAMNSPNFGATEARQLDAQLRQLLGDTDPFWMRWRFIGEKRGWLT